MNQSNQSIMIIHIRKSNNTVKKMVCLKNENSIGLVMLTGQLADGVSTTFVSEILNLPPNKLPTCV